MTLIDEAYGEVEGSAQIVVGDYYGKTLHITDEEWFQWPADRDRLHAFVEENSATNVYFATCLFSRLERSVTTATKTNLVYIDADACGPENFRVAPTITILTSPGHYQLYWLLDEPVDARDASEVAHKMCVAHKDDGCDQSGWITAKLMRVPGSTHAKTMPTHKVREIEHTGEMFTLADLADAYADVEIPVTGMATDTPMPEQDDLPMPIDVASKLSDFSDLYDLYLYEPTEADDWSVLRWKLETQMFRVGFDAVEVYVAIKNTHYNKYAVKNRPDADLWHEVLKAQATVDLDVPDTVDEPSGHAPVTLNKTIEFVSDAERADIQPGFPDEFEEWVATRSPHAAHKFSRFLSFMLLSNVYGAWGYITPQFGRMKLNLWMLMLGQSTSDRKSTVRDLMLEVVHAWERRLPEGSKIALASDFTGEGLNNALAERDGEVSYMDSDEVSGFFRELFTKNYLAGTIERMTALYAGRVMKTLRANAKASQQKDAEAVFNFLGVGIEKHTAEELTEKNFASGFLPRMIWCVADAAPWTPDREVVGQLDESEPTAKDMDTHVTEFCNQFSKGRRKWGTGKQHRIAFTEEALARWNQWKIDSKALIQGTDYEDLVEPSRDRMSYTIWKVAALLAMHDKSDTIEMRHLLYVLRESEVWFADMIRMANQVSASDFETKLNEVEQYVIGLKNGANRTQLYRRFSSFRKGEVDEFLGNLLAQGRITVQEGRFKISE